MIRIPCCICRKDDFIPVADLMDGAQSGYCAQCGLAYINPRLPEREILAGYRQFSQRYPKKYLLAPDCDMARFARHRFQFSSAGLDLTRPGRVLEIGCAYGHFLKKFADTAWEAYGIEPSKSQSAFARQEFGLAHIINRPFQEMEPDRKGFDLIVLFHVLEHLFNPYQLLLRVYSLLKPEGRLVIAVPNLVKSEANIIDFLFMRHMLHLYTFTPQTLTNLLSETGYTVGVITEEDLRPVHGYGIIIQASPGPIQSEGKFDAPPLNHLLKNFHRKIETHTQIIREKFNWWRIQGKRVAVYGAGLHTTGLLEMIQAGPGEVAALIDDDPAKIGRPLMGIPVYSKKILNNKEFDIILVSSLASEAGMIKQLTSLARQGQKIIGIYRDLMKGDYT